MRFEITTCTQRRNSHVQVGQLLPHPAIRRSVLLSVNLNVESLIAGSRSHLEIKKMRFEITTCTQRRNSHVEVGQLLPHPAIRRSVLLSVNLNVESLIAGSRSHLEIKKMRFEITTCTQRRNSHVEVGQLLPHPAIRRSVLLSVNLNVESLIAGSRSHLEIIKNEI